MKYYVYDINNNNVYVDIATYQFSNSTTTVPPSLNRTDYCYDVSSDSWVIDQDFLDARAATKKQERIDSLLIKFSNLCDQKIRDAFEYYTGNTYSELLLNRYKSKYDTAKRYKADGNSTDENLLQLEADLKGMAVDDFADLIIQMGDSYNVLINEINIKIDAIRVKIKNMLVDDGALDEVKIILTKMKALPFNASNDDIKAIFPS